MTLNDKVISIPIGADVWPFIEVGGKFILPRVFHDDGRYAVRGFYKYGGALHAMIDADHPVAVAYREMKSVVDDGTNERPSRAPDDHWPTDAAYQLGDIVKTPREPVWEGLIVGWYRNSKGRLGYNVESTAIPLAIHVYPETGLVLVKRRG